jgi:hypothetical protein
LSCADIMSNRLIVAAPIAVLSFPGSGHTCVSCPHQAQQCPHNTLWPKSDSPNRASSSNSGIGGTSASMSAPSASPITPISIPSAVSSPPNARDRAERSAPLLHSLQIHILPGLQFPSPLSLAPSLFGTDTSEPKRHGTDSAISCVITYEICSLLPPYALMLSATTRRKDSSERPFRPFPFGTGLASPHPPTRRVGISTLN